MILSNFSQKRANKLSKMMLPAITEPINIKILWLQCEDFIGLSKRFNNKLHKHTFFELHFVLDGKAIVVNNSPKEHTLHCGEAIIIAPNSPHAFKFNKELKRFSIAFTLPENTLPADFLTDFTIITLSDRIIANLNMFFEQADKNTVLSQYIIRNRLLEILFELLELEKHMALHSTVQSSNTNLYIDKSKKYIKNNLNIILTCKDVADYCHINEIYLNRIFKKHTSETLLKYIHRKKIDYSIELLKNKDLPLSTVSTMLGFSNEYYFNTFFKKAVGMPPGAYRNMKLKAR